jgi:predicted type IV restriction endonuclease
VRG